MTSLNGKIAVMTGGTGGIGLAAATLFAREGAEVVITGRRQDALDAAAQTIGSRATIVQGDVADPAHHERVAAVVADRFGGADIYMANAGVNTIPASHAVSEDEYDAQFGINARGPLDSKNVV